MKKRYDVVALGELLIDFTQNGFSESGNPILEANPGGAPCNVLAMLNKRGKKTGFIGKVGKDMFGEQLEKAIKDVGIDTTGLIKDDTVHTTLAFVHTLPGGDREFSFYRNPGSDMMLTPEEVNEDMIKSAKIFHFGSLSMTHEVVRAATKKAIEIAKKSGAIISFDPNLREPLWSSLELAKEMIRYGMTQCDILKISDNEIQWFTGKEDFDEGIECIKKEFSNIRLILLSLGKDGSRAYIDDKRVFVPAFVQKNTIETTGAGDTFCANVLNYILDHDLDNLSEEELKDMLTVANAAAAIVTTRKGALAVMPTVDEIMDCIRQN